MKGSVALRPAEKEPVQSFVGDLNDFYRLVRKPSAGNR